ncbi:30S ribosomal protein S16 [candidate division KSB1 bacterium]|nr:30S ribosomal protein S16 [candidate division KSB1 bacterium]
MAVRIRLRRMGKKKSPFYRIVAIDSRRKREGIYLDKIGHYNPMLEPAEIVIDQEKALSWLEKGAVPSDTVKSLFSRQGIMLKYDMTKKKFSPEKMQEELQKWELMQAERTKRLSEEKPVKKNQPEPTPEEPVVAAE